MVLLVVEMPTQVKSMQDTSEWSKVFPPKIDTKSLSCVFMKKLFAVALSNILFLRRIFPERAFKDKQIEGLVIKILKNEGEFPPAERLINWARGCFDALEKGYLKTVIVGIHTNAEDFDTAIESYSFRFTYSDPEKSDNSFSVDIKSQSKTGSNEDLSKKFTNADVKRTTLSLLRTLILASKAMGDLPSDVYITMKLLYHDEITPPEYEPPGFRPADYSSFRYLSETMSLLVGNVETGHHNMQLKLKTDKETFIAHMSGIRNRELSKATGNSLLSESIVESRKIRADDTPTSVSLTGLDKDEGDTEKWQHEGGGASAPMEIATPNSSAAATPGLSSEKSRRSRRNLSTVAETNDCDYEVCCPCKFSGDDGIMIVCDFCHKWQHALCFGILDEDDAPQSHICDVCAEQRPELTQNSVTDPSLLHLDGEEKMATCVYRRILMMCKQTSPDVVLTPKEISRQLGVEIGVSQGLMSRLKNEGVLKQSGNIKTRRSKAAGDWKVDRDVLESVMTRTFAKREIHQASQEVESMCVTVGVDMDNFDREMQEAEKLLAETQNLHLSQGKTRSSRQISHKRRASVNANQDKQAVSPVVRKKKKVSLVRTPQRIL